MALATISNWTTLVRVKLVIRLLVGPIHGEYNLCFYSARFLFPLNQWERVRKLMEIGVNHGNACVYSNDVDFHTRFP